MSIICIPSWTDEKEIAFRETKNGAYSWSAFTAAHAVVSIPFLLVLALFSGLITHFLVNLRPGTGPRVVFVAVLWASLHACEALGFFFAMICKHYVTAIGWVVIILSLGTATMGGLVRVEKIPWVLRWFRFVSFQYWANGAILVSQFVNDFFPLPPGPSFLSLPLTGNFILLSVGFRDFQIWVGLVAVVAYSTIFRFLAFLYLRMWH